MSWNGTLFFDGNLDCQKSSEAANECALETHGLLKRLDVAHNGLLESSAEANAALACATSIAIASMAKAFWTVDSLTKSPPPFVLDKLNPDQVAQVNGRIAVVKAAEDAEQAARIAAINAVISATNAASASSSSSSSQAPPSR